MEGPASSTEVSACPDCYLSTPIAWLILAAAPTAHEELIVRYLPDSNIHLGLRATRAIDAMSVERALTARLLHNLQVIVDLQERRARITIQ